MKRGATTRGTKLRRLSVAAVLVACVAFAPPAQARAHRGPCLLAQPHGPTCLIWTGRVTFVADGDTVDVAIDGGGKHRVRVTGINANELSVYSPKASRRRGQCHGVAAADQLERLIKKSHWRVRLLAQHASSHSGPRLRRALEVRIGGRWVDPDAIQLTTGLALWLPNGQERAWNRSYAALAKAAAARRVGMYNSRSCGRVPEENAQLSAHVNWDAAGDDRLNPNGEWIEITNLGDTAVRVGGWHVKDSDLKYYRLPSWAKIPANGSIRVHVGRGHSAGTSFYWGFSHPLFDNTIGDGGYLFDTHTDLRAWDIYTP